MMDRELSRRAFLQGAVAGGALAAGGSVFGLTAGAEAAPGQPVPPITMTYYGNWQEIVEFFRKAAEDLRKVGLTPKLSPAPSMVVVPKTLQQHDYGDWSSIMWGATPERLDPNFYLKETLRSGIGRNYGFYSSAKYDEVADAQEREMDPVKRQKLVRDAQAVAAADFPAWWLAHPVHINAYNQRDFDGASEIMGGGYGSIYSAWNYVHVRPKTARKTFKSGMQVEINTLNPFSPSTSPNQSFVRFFYDPFAIVGADLKPRPWAAESWKIVDPTTIDLVLRSGMKFHDGVPVTDEDVRFTFEYLKKWDFPFFRHATAVIKSVETKGRDVRFRLTEPYAPFFFITLTWLFILPKHIWKDIPEKVGVKHPGEFENPQMIGSGPFRFGHWRKGQEIYFKANKEHFSAPAVDDVYFVIIPSMDGNAGALERGEVDVNQNNLTPALADRLMEKPFLKVAYTPSHGVYDVRADLRKKPFSDVNFRKAVYHALDRRPLVNFYGGKALLAGNTPITPLNAFWHHPGLPAPEYSIDRARDTLRKAGYTWDGSGNLVMPA